MWTMRSTCVWTLVALLWSAPKLEAATIFVPAGGDLQRALNDARPGDTILLQENAEFVGNFVLPMKTGDAWIVLRSAAPDTVLPGAGIRIQPSHASLLARLRSPNSSAALRTAPGAHHWDIRYIEFRANQGGLGDIIQLGDGSSAQNSLAQVPHHLVLNHVYVHGDPLFGQKRGIALNAATVTISDSHISDCKGVGQDTQAIGGWNGPGPYVIENNYLEAAGENVLIGGSDPAIPNLVADNVTVRRNYFSRPMSWRDPLVATPQAVTAAATTSGSLPAGTYGYRVIARRLLGTGAMTRSTASSEAQVTTGAPGAVRVRWQAVPGATEYRVYGRAAGAENIYWTVTGTEFIDTGASGSSEAVPISAGTLWSVKNIFELKNARNVVVAENIFENHWRESQSGYAIVLTPRNSGGGCNWCVVENVRFEYNVVRNVAAGINVLGYDSSPTRQTTNISVTHNLFTGLNTTLGGNGWFMLIGDEPRNITINHNTVDSNGNALVYTYGGNSTDPREIYGLEMVANASRHGSYGFNGQYFTYGTGILNGYYPAAVFSANYLSGASLSRYPAGTLAAGLFQDQFVSTSGGDYTVRAGSILKGAAPDGSDIGADFPALASKVAGVVAGIMGDQPAPPPPPPPSPVGPTADFAVSCTFLECDFSDSSTVGSGAIASRTWTFGDGSPAVTNVTAGVHVFTAAGSYSIALQVTDVNGLSSTASTLVTVRASNVAPVAAFTPTCVDLTCTFTDNSTDADGTVTAWAWSFGSSSSTQQSPSFAFPAPGSYTVTLTVTDDDGAQSAIAVPVQVTAVLHAAYSGFTTRWSSPSGSTTYWSAEVTVAIHGADERIIPGAKVTAAWTGAVAKTASCVTKANGACTLRSGTLSYGRSTVTLSVTSVTESGSVFDAGASHDPTRQTSSFTLIRP
jgi:PKD repeat protein